MLSSPRACRKCGKASVKEGYCAEHQQASARGEKRLLDAVDRMYHRQPWPAFRLVMLGQNPICQRLDKSGVQCREWASIVHHLVSPRKRPDLFVEPSNVACLCANCHPPDEGTEWWRVGKEYVQTEFRLPNLGAVTFPC
jgi:hypothetical protein